LLRQNPKFSTKPIFRCGNALDVIEHIPPDELPKIIEKVAKLLKPGGTFIVSVPSENIPVSDKHYQHNDENSLLVVQGNDFTIENISGQHRLGLSNTRLRI